MRLADLRGNVVLLDVWTFGCVNCVWTVPWVRDVTGRSRAAVCEPSGSVRPSVPL